MRRKFYMREIWQATNMSKINHIFYMLLSKFNRISQDELVPLIEPRAAARVDAVPSPPPGGANRRVRAPANADHTIRYSGFACTDCRRQGSGNALPRHGDNTRTRAGGSPDPALDAGRPRIES